MNQATSSRTPRVTFQPLTSERWSELERLFGPRGACGGCWCMWFRLSAKEFNAGKGEGNRRAMRDLVAAGRIPGILAYRDREPVGWCSVAPRDEFPRLQRSKILAPIDDLPVWSVVCLFVAGEHRDRGVSTALLRAAVEHVKEHGGAVVEGYAVEPKKKRIPDPYAFHGLKAAYIRAGFTEVARRSETRPIMRFVIKR